MAERVHEVLQEEGRARGEDEQRQVLFVKAEGPVEQLCVQAERHQPVTPPSANTSHTGTLAENSATTAPISARLVKPK